MTGHGMSNNKIFYNTEKSCTLLSFISEVMRVPPGHMFNPYSMSCLKVYTEVKIQPDAKAFCESIGEQLATFRTLESMQWFQNLHTTTPGKHSAAIEC